MVDGREGGKKVVMRYRMLRGQFCPYDPYLQIVV